MAELKSALESSGFVNVKTYIQSGNVVLQTTATKGQVQEAIKTMINERFGLDVEVFVLTLKELEVALHHNPFGGECAPTKVYVTFLYDVPNEALVENLKAVDHGAESFEVNHNVLYFYVPDGMANAKMSNNYFEKKLKIVATGRNLNTVGKMIALAQ